MLHKEFFGLVFLAFVAWIFMAANPTERIERGCRPIAWVGNGTTSLSSLVVPSQQTKVQGWFDKVEYGCRYVTWRLFYQEAYNTWLKTQGLNPEGTKPAEEGAAPTKPAAKTPPQEAAPAAPAAPVAPAADKEAAK